nr:FAD/NAD(P)-binding protein [Mycobacterium sp. Marseille-P9652]
MADDGHGANTSRLSPEPTTVFDIAFIGSGVACSMTLLELAEILLRPGLPQPRLRIAVVERDEEFWSGIPYGRRTSVRSLAIQKLDDFVTGPERSAYIAWLERNKAQWLASFQEHGGEAAACWIRDNREALDANSWGGLYLPRYLFGVFIAEQVNAAIAELRERDLAEVVTIHAEAISARAAQGHFLIGLSPCGEGPTEIEAGKVIAAIGSPPTKSIVECGSDPAFTYIDDFYLPCEETNLQRLRESLDRIEPREKRNVLVVGSNATSLEALYLMRHDTRIRERIHSITVVSRSGMLPYKICDEPPEFEFPRLNALLGEETVEAADLMSAIRADLGIAEERSLNLADLYDAIGVLVAQALAQMDIAQQEEFYCVHGMNFTKLVRRAGRDCRQASEELVADGTLNTLAGEVLRVEPCASGQPFATMIYRAGGAEHVHPVPFSVVVNCGGFEELDACSSPFLVSVMQNGLCRPNRTNRGVFVNDDFEASPAFYFIGPLIGGNFNSRIRLWHVENAPRIRSLAKSLAATLVASLEQTVSAHVAAGTQKLPAGSLVSASMVPVPVVAREGERGA